MPVMAVCPTCEKSYSAPDSMAGKSVRCKACQTVFRIADLEPDVAAVDFDQLEQSFGGEDATEAGGPSIDRDGRVSIQRRGDVAAIDYRGENGPGGMRTNLRFRYPFARAVDLGLPYVVLLLALGLPLWLSLTRGADAYEEPRPGVGISRYIVLLLAFLTLVFPATHLAVGRAARELRFHLPRTPLWRSLACASGVLAVAGTTFILGGGRTPGIIMGILVGTATCVALCLLLFRTLPHEMPKVSGYVAIGAGLGATLAALAIAGLNFAAASIARTQAEPTLFQSPIAIGAAWVDPPAVVIGPKKPTPPRTPVAVNPIATKPAVPTPVVTTPSVPQLVSLSLEQFAPSPEARKFFKSAEQPPIAPGFAQVIRPLVQAPALGIVRTVGGGQVEVWDAARWVLPLEAIGTRFDANSPLFVSPKGERVVRMVTSPVLRIEAIPLGSNPTFRPITLDGKFARAIEGFNGDNSLIVRAHTSRGIALERYDLKTGVQLTPDAIVPAGEERRPQPLSTVDASNSVAYPLSINEEGQSIRFAPDGKVVVAGREGFGENKATLALFDVEHPDKELAKRTVPWDRRAPFAPMGMAVSDAHRIALLLDAGGESFLTVWRMSEERLDGDASVPNEEALFEARLGTFGTIRPAGWRGTSDAVLWLDRDTLLVYGQTLVDARNGAILGTAPVPNAVAVTRLGDDEMLFHTFSSGLLNLIRVRYDVDYLKSLRK